MIEMTLSSRQQDSKFEPWRSEAEHATSRSRRLRTILTFTRGWGRNPREGCLATRIAQTQLKKNKFESV